MVNLLPDFVKPQEVNLVGVLPSPSDNYIITATIIPLGAVSDISQYFSFKVKPFENNQKYGDIFPSLFVLSNTQKLFFSYRTTAGLEATSESPAVGLVMNQENEVRIEAFGVVITLYINDQEVSSVEKPMSQQPKLLEPLCAFTSERCYARANGYIKDLIYMSIDPEKLTIFSPTTIDVSQGNKIGVV